MKLNFNPKKDRFWPKQHVALAIDCQPQANRLDVYSDQVHDLGDNKIGDAGVTALAEACASGALAKLEGVHRSILLGNPGNSEPLDKVLRERGGS